MNVYDFDKTIYNGDSSIAFTLFCMRNYPCTLKVLALQIRALILYKIGKIEKTEMKEMLFSYLSKINDIDVAVDEFWVKHEKKIKLWYLAQKKSDDIIISASPEFLLSPICRKMNVNLIASEVNKRTGEFVTANCYGIEKVARYRKQYKDAEIDEMYTDSYSDKPLAEISKKAFLVKKNKVTLWICNEGEI